MKPMKLQPDDFFRMYQIFWSIPGQRNLPDKQPPIENPYQMFLEMSIGSIPTPCKKSFTTMYILR